MDLDAELVTPGSLRPWAKNPRKNDAAVPAVVESIRRFGFAAPIIARRETREVVAGHTRLKAAQQIGLESVPVRWIDLDESEAHALALADNKLAEIADWDEDTLAEVLRGLEVGLTPIDSLGWSSDELAAMLNPPPADPQGDPDDVPDVQPDPVSVSGEVYELGPHRLLCGDSTDPEAWGRLLLDGERLQMVWTDPPYGVSYVSGRRDPRDTKNYGKGDTLQNDDLDEADLYKLIRGALRGVCDACQPGAAWYVAAPAGPPHNIFGTVLIELEVWRRSLVWLKDHFVFGRGDYHYRHEPIFYGWKPGAAHYFTDDRTLDSIIECPNPKGGGVGRGEHPTMKPVDLVRHCIRNSSKPGWLVGEPFGGSGTTLIASACEGRVARVIELDPRYCDVIRRRWTRWAKENGVEVGSGGLE